MPKRGPQSRQRRAHRDSHWRFDDAPNERRMMHRLAGGQLYATGDWFGCSATWLDRVQSPFRPTSSDAKWAHTTVSFLALQFNTLMKQFVATRKVPLAHSDNLEDQTFVVSIREASAVIEFFGPDLPIGGQQFASHYSPLPRATSMIRRAARYKRGSMESSSMYSLSAECAPKPCRPKRSTTGAFVPKAAKAASVPPPSG